MSNKSVFLSVPLVALLWDTNENRRYRAFYGQLAKTCQQRNFEVYEPYFYGHPVEHDYIRPDEIYNNNRRKIANSVLLIAYVGITSSGVSMEVEIANSNYVPVILLYEDEKAGSVSKMLLGCPVAKDHITAPDTDGLATKLESKFDAILVRLGEEQIGMPGANQSSFVNLLNKTHIASKSSLSQVAKLAGVDKGYLHRLLNGAIESPGRDQLIKLCGWGWRLDRDETNKILLAGEYPTLW